LNRWFFVAEYDVNRKQIGKLKPIKTRTHPIQGGFDFDKMFEEFKPSSKDSYVFALFKEIAPHTYHLIDVRYI